MYNVLPVVSCRAIIEASKHTSSANMIPNNAAIKEFLESIPNEKLKNFASSEKTLFHHKKLVFRLDHQGVNQDGSMKDRLYIQPTGGNSYISMADPKSVIAQIHVTDPGNPRDIRKALWDSYKHNRSLIILP